MRRPILAANWKMNLTSADVSAYTNRFIPLVADAKDVDIVIAAPFTLLDRLANELAGTAIQAAGQNVHPEESGAFTGEIAAAMLADMGCAYAIVGHSERRALFGESSAFVAKKASALLRCEIRPIVCVGETLQQRDAGRALEVVETQLRESLAEIPGEQAEQVVVAYEPVWAIGTGRTATPEIAQEVHAHIRKQLSAQFGEAGNRIRIQYGGSVKPETVYDLMNQPDIDGALVGGASLDPEAFSRIVLYQNQRNP
ncbi:MAG: triose-phosphate isomerase [Deltaproteobacteria bacterium]|jgi:triosephosphate isomerase|nr:triose-phosphate isomerase [Deltaproteobacteria bacterium]MBW2541791.1 triose-phosphate isomerase [Deltaproteobacteria bacterium]